MAASGTGIAGRLRGLLGRRGAAPDGAGQETAAPPPQATEPAEVVVLAPPVPDVPRQVPEQVAPSRRQTAPAKKAAVQRGAVQRGAAKKAPVEKAPVKKAAVKKAAVKKAAVKEAPVKKAAVKKAAAATAPAPALPALPAVGAGEEPWTRAELAALRDELQAQAAELRAEIGAAESAAQERERSAAGEMTGDEADVGSKAFEREHELSLANNSRDLLLQVERALGRIDAGTYGACERCGAAVPKARLQAFPRMTLCVACKTREERR